MKTWTTATVTHTTAGWAVTTRRHRTYADTDGNTIRPHPAIHVTRHDTHDEALAYAINATRIISAAEQIGWTMGRLQAAYRAFVVDLSTGFSRGIGATQ